MLVILFVILILLSAFFSAVEIATVSLSLLKVRTLLKQGKSGAESLLRIKKDSHRLLIAILIGNNLVNIAAAAIATAFVTKLFGSSGVGIATGAMTFIILVFGEVAPKSLAVVHAEKIALKLARPLEILVIILSPAIFFFEIIARLLGAFSKRKILTQEELHSIITISREEGILDKEAMEMIHSVLEFEETRVVKVYTPKEKVISLPGSLTIKEAAKQIASYPFDRYPIYEASGNITGIVDAADMLANLQSGGENKLLKEIAKTPIFVSEDDYIDSVLLKFKSREHPMAIVKNSQDQVTGVVTVQDLIDEIIGDVFEKEEFKIIKS